MSAPGRKVKHVTRTHLLAILSGHADLLVEDDDGRLRVWSAQAWLDSGRGRIVITRGDLHDAGAEITGSRAVAGAGPLLDRIARELSTGESA